ncbi:hypothetical protein [Leptospira sp. GIMC2001]|uniref:hypothetical protein n=1 Tax=Leptospira sp. GIMC2001 TaxID=1513297 RepID=UPI0023497B59|nr:hypothetical protein [Leptospira sp. GIMC2001]WCL50716.1 hypothetical protein O4O04_07870 [Leptospira sp. GIMC2001]
MWSGKIGTEIPHQIWAEIYRRHPDWGKEAILENTDRAKMDQAVIDIYKKLYSEDTISNPDGSINVKGISRETAKKRMDEIMDHLTMGN